MILVWNSPQSFRDHLDNMKQFRKNHFDGKMIDLLKVLRSLPVPYDNVPPATGTPKAKSITDANGKIILVPIWRTTLPRGAQN